MAIYIRSRPTTGTKVLGCLGTLAAVGIALLYPLILVLTAFALGSLEKPSPIRTTPAQWATPWLRQSWQHSFTASC